MDHARVYVGWDSRDPRALDVCLFSIQRHASDLVEIVSLKPTAMTALCGPETASARRDRDRARYLVPSLNAFDGWAVFVSSDVLLQADIYDLWRRRDPRYAAMGVAVGPEEPQVPLMSSVLLWNCGHPANRSLMPGAVAARPVEDLARLCWLPRDTIGFLPPAWCWREGVSDPAIAPKAIEFAPRKPWVAEAAFCRYADRWQDEARRVFGSLAAGIGQAAQA